MSQERSTSRSPSRRSNSNEQDPKILQAQLNAKKGMQKRKKKSFWDKYAYHIVIGGFVFVCATVLISTFFSKSRKIHLTPVIDEEEIDVHNSANLGFTLGRNDFFDGLKLSDAKPIFNNQFSFKSSLMRCSSSEESTIIEDNYDFRAKYKNCVNPIITQGNCSSSYAIATANAVSDRICMQTGENVNLSAQVYLSCANGTKNCEGGAIASVLDYSKKEGLVTGSCLPYSGEKNTTCPNEVLASCARYTIADYCVSSTAEGIKREILKNGPVIAVLPAYRDFLIYKDGIYHVIEGTSRFQGGHAIKILGWGKSPQGVDYWIAENTWGDSWGINGYAHIAVGQKNLYIDEFVMSANPRVAKQETVDASDSSSGDTGSATSSSSSADTNIETEDLDSDK